MIEFFRARVRWLKESNMVESRAEKPYLDLDYRKMHLDWPVWDWPTPSGYLDIPPGPFGDLSGQNVILWEPGNCWLGVASCECGESFSLTGRVVNLPPRTHGTTFEWQVWSENDEVRIDSIEPNEDGTEVTVNGTVIGEVFSGVATICGMAALAGGNLVFRTVWSGEPNQFSQWTGPSLESEIIETDYYEGALYDCGCTQVSVECGIDCAACEAVAYDDDNSADTIARAAAGDTEEVTVAVTGTCGPFTWSVEGTGFSLENAQTSGLTNTLIADDTACGVAAITITDACDNETTGNVQCTTGSWENCGSVYVGGSISGCGTRFANCTAGITAQACWSGIQTAWGNGCTNPGANPDKVCPSGYTVNAADPFVEKHGFTVGYVSRSGNITLYHWKC